MDLAEMLAEEGFEVVGQVGDGERAAALAITPTGPGDHGRQDARQGASVIWDHLPGTGLVPVTCLEAVRRSRSQAE
ncbi:MAG TPA: hypothetical protein VES60_12495 [Nakamurella sp.]|nr:hypothetical protein [Nakamurella sp.]